jgi:phosphoribosylglycinamide formyltransferase-1
MSSTSKQYKLIILASGGGTNAENLIHYFHSGERARITCVITNNKNAGVISRATKAGVLVRILSNEICTNGSQLLPILQKENPDLIILAGYLKKIPAAVVQAFPNRIINIHPSLLPNYGGKGMYGMKVHEAVYANQETTTGITVHFVNEAYDEGNIILQKSVAVSPTDNPNDIATKIHDLEMTWFPVAVEHILDTF